MRRRRGLWDPEIPGLPVVMFGQFASLAHLGEVTGFCVPFEGIEQGFKNSIRVRIRVYIFLAED